MFSRLFDKRFILFVLLSTLTIGYSVEIDVITPDSKVAVQADASLRVSEGGVVCFEGDSLRYISQSGEPAIPWHILTVLLPSDIDLDALSITTEAIFETCGKRGEVVPMPPIATRDQDGNEIVTWPLDKDIVEGCDYAIYESDAFWPSRNARLLETGSLRGWKMAEIGIPLFRYNPVSGAVEQLTDAVISLTELTASSGTASSRVSSAASSVLVDRAGLERARELAVNFSQSLSSYASSSQLRISESSGQGYAIITTNAIVEASSVLSDFITHKEARGFSVSVVTENDFGGGTGDTASANIRSWLQGNYNDLEYVLLIGDPTTTSEIPMKMCLGDQPTDYFYAELTADWDLDGDGVYGEQTNNVATNEMEKYFELYVGRIPYYGDVDDLDSILQKTIDYEISTDTAWRRNAFLPMIPLNSKTPSYQLGESIKTHLDAKGYDYDRVYKDYYGVLSRPEYLCSDIYPASLWAQNDYGLVVWCTHGAAGGANGVIETPHVEDLDNHHPSAIYQGSCGNGYPENDENIAYLILKQGGITTCAASREGWFYSGGNYINSSTQGGIGYEYARRLLVNNDSCGKALWDTKEYLNIWVLNYYVMNLYGDPSVAVTVDPGELEAIPSSATCFYRTYNSSTSLGSTELTLTNYTDATAVWTAVSDANWLDLSISEGVLSSGQNTTLTLSLNAEAELLTPETYTAKVMITNLSNSMVETHDVIFEVFADKLVCYLEMEDASGTNASDSSGNDVNAELSYTFNFDDNSVEGIYGQALRFSEYDDYVSIPGDLPRLNLYTNNLTLTCWIKRTIDQEEGAGIIFTKPDDSDDTVAGLTFQSDNTLGYCWNDKDGIESTAFSVPADTWTFVALVVEPTAGIIYMYDGTTMHMSQNVTSHAIETFGSRLYLGNNDYKFFEGLMDDVRIYNYALNTSEIQDLALGNRAEICKPLDWSHCSTAAVLTWTAAANAESHQLYFGESYAEVVAADTESTLYRGELTECQWDPELALGHTYYWRVDEVLSDSTVVPGDVWRFTTVRAATYEFWSEMNSGGISGLTSLDAYPDSPDISKELSRLKGQADWSDTYGSRIHGYLLPKTNGYCWFWISADDAGELWLSSDDDEDNVVRIAYTSGYTNEDDFDNHATQKSSAVYLFGGRRYYFEILQAESTGGDHLSVAWKGPDSPTRSIIDAAYLLPYGGDNSVPEFNDYFYHSIAAKEGLLYSGTLEDMVTDPEGDGVAFYKARGPKWLSVKLDGSFSGTPQESDAGTNEFLIYVRDDFENKYNVATWTINVVDRCLGNNGITDLTCLANRWLATECTDCAAEDLDGDLDVDMDDFLILAQNWLID